MVNANSDKSRYLVDRTAGQINVQPVVGTVDAPLLRAVDTHGGRTLVNAIVQIVWLLCLLEQSFAKQVPVIL